MKQSEKKLLVIEFLMLFIIVLNFFLTKLLQTYTIVIFLAIVFMIIFLLLGFEKNNNPNRIELLKNLCISLSIYFIIIYLLGLIIGFNRTIYNLNINNFIWNILPVTLIIVLSEFIRFEIIRKSNNKGITVIISIILFILLDASINFGLYDLSSGDELFEYLGLILFSSISKNIFMTILSIKSGYENCMVYRLITELYIFIIPIVPAFGPYINAIINITLPVILCFEVFQFYRRKILEKPMNRKNNMLSPIIIISIIFVVVCLNSGLFKYYTLTIGSNSMRNYITKGDVILVEKKNTNQINDIDVGNILVYNYNGKIIAHRVYKKYNKDGKIYFKTKGDKNNQPDSNMVSSKDIIGLATHRIKYVGLPSVWVNELFD